jgi:hypothetical protein
MTMITTNRHDREAVGVMYAGLGLTVAAMLTAYVDQATTKVLANHIRAGYPTYTPARIDTAVTIYLVYLSAVGALGILGWLWAIRILRAGKRWSRAAATTLFVIGSSVAITDLLIKDTSGETGLPPLLGWAGILPCLAGLTVVVLLWRRSSPVAVRRQT